MNDCHITLSANAGVALRLGQTRVWIDALHQCSTNGFSSLSPRLAQEVLAHPDFASPDLIFFTHCHPDHFSLALTEQAHARWPLARVILPEQMVSEQRVLSAPREQLLLPETSIHFARLPHEGAQYADVAQYGCVLEHQGFRVLITGDCAVAAPELATFLEEVGPVDLALLDFPWVTLKKGRRFIQDYIRPRHLLLYHLPFLEDDVFCYRPATKKAVAAMETADVRVLWEPLQQETF